MHFPTSALLKNRIEISGIGLTAFATAAQLNIAVTQVIQPTAKPMPGPKASRAYTYEPPLRL